MVLNDEFNGKWVTDCIVLNHTFNEKGISFDLHARILNRIYSMVKT